MNNRAVASFSKDFDLQLLRRLQLLGASIKNTFLVHILQSSTFGLRQETQPEEISFRHSIDNVISKWHRQYHSQKQNRRKIRMSFSSFHVTYTDLSFTPSLFILTSIANVMEPVFFMTLTLLFH